MLSRAGHFAYEGRTVQRARVSFFRSTRRLAIALALLGVLPAAPARADGLPPLPRAELLDRALAEYYRVERTGMLRKTLLTVIDYSLPSSERRLWVFDLQQPLRVLFHEFVAHGRGSTTDDDPDRAIWFGNEEASLRSSLGAFVTGATYMGQHGHSLELYGLEPGVNDNAYARRIVMHPAEYVSAAFRAQHGRVGRSFGCPALDPAVSDAVIDRIAGGSVIYAEGSVATPDLRTASAASR